MSGGDSKLASGERDGAPLFPTEKLHRLSKWNEISQQAHAKNLLARSLLLSDFDAGYLDLLSQLTHVGLVTYDDFKARFDEMKQINQINDHYVVVVLEDKTTHRVVATSTLFLEYKFIHQCAMRGRLEDVAVLDSHRGNQIGELVVKIIVELAREVYKCYKLTLDCRDDLVKFYAKNNFAHGSNMLAIRFDH